MHSWYEQEEDTLDKIVNKHVKSQANVQMKLLIYYKNRTVANWFVKNNPLRKNPEQRSLVVYTYTCKTEEGHHSEKYVGQTTTSLKKRITTQAQNGLSKNHIHDTYHCRLRASEALLNYDVLTAKNLC